MKFQGQLTEGTLLRREKRFLAYVAVPAGELVAHVPNSGRLGELLFPGNRVLLSAAPVQEGTASPQAVRSRSRRTAYTLVAAWSGREWVCVVSAWANPLTKEAAAAGLLPALARYPAWRPEVPWGGSRLDFLLSGPGMPPCLVEVKGVTLVTSDGLALFPDAPTERGTRHLGELIRVAEQGERAAVVFAVQREDAERVSPNRVTDPAFAAALARAAQAGVELLAFTCRVSPQGMLPGKAIPVHVP